jgi:hypothetical protein
MEKNVSARVTSGRTKRSVVLTCRNAATGGGGARAYGIRKTAACYETLSFETTPTAGNIKALSAVALTRDRRGEAGDCSVEAKVDGLPVGLAGAKVARLRMRAGLARPALDFVFKFTGEGVTSGGALCEPPGDARTFAFEGGRCLVDGCAVAMKEFSLSVNNNLLITPVNDDDDEGLHLTAGRQSLTGYVCVEGAHVELVDGRSHRLEIALPGTPGGLIIAAKEIAFTWTRRIESAVLGELEVIYFEDSSEKIESGLSITLEK